MKRKTRKAKEAAKRRFALQREKRQKLEKIEKEITNYKDLIKQGRIKNLKVYTKRGFKTLGSIALSTLPFTIAFTLVSGIAVLSDSGLPFVRDDVEIYNYIDGQMDSLGNYSISSEYLSSSSEDQYCNVDMFSPWEKQDDQTYERTIYKYEFDSSDINMKEMKEYISKSDYKSINELSDEKIVIHEMTKSLNKDEINDEYFIEGKFYYKDKDDSIVVTESVSQNVLTTVAPFIVGVLIEILAYGVSDCELFDGIFNSANYGHIEDIKQLKLKLKRKEKELEQAKGGNLNGKKRR